MCIRTPISRSNRWRSRPVESPTRVSRWLRKGPASLNRILGIDPGSRVTGYGVIECRGREAVYVDSGCIRIPACEFAVRLRIIFQSVGELVAQHRPRQLAIEQVFVQKNPSTALKLGHARGAAICAAVQHELPVSEYSPREIKLAVVGRGGADKAQVQHMMRMLLQLDREPPADAADALAVALCHFNTHTGREARRLAAAGPRP